MPPTEETCLERSVLVVDDHRTVAELLRLAVDFETDLVCVGVAYDASMALAMARALHPDVVVCDLNLEVGRPTGLAVASLLTVSDPGVVVLLLTGDPGEVDIQQLRDSGASGLLAKDGDLAALIRAVRRAERDQLDIDPRLLRALTAPSHEPAVRLSRREHQVLQLMARGRSIAAISRLLGIQPTTCRGYVKSVLHKLGAHSQLEAVARAREQGLLEERR